MASAQEKGCRRPPRLGPRGPRRQRPHRSHPGRDRPRELPASEPTSTIKRTIPGATEVPMPRNLSPMLAELGKGTPPTGNDWLFEIKWDGVRALCYLDHGQLRMVSRNRQRNMERQYPELSILPHHVKAKTAILDGEIAALDDRGYCPALSFCNARITAVADAKRHRDPRQRARIRWSSSPSIFCISTASPDLRGIPLIERKRLLKGSPQARRSGSAIFRAPLRGQWTRAV